jgi:hypothetical protein
VRDVSLSKRRKWWSRERRPETTLTFAKRFRRKEKRIERIGSGLSL